MIGMRRGLWGKVSRQNQNPREVYASASASAASGMSGGFLAASTVVTSSPEIFDQMPAAEETTFPPSSKRAKLEADMPSICTNTVLTTTPPVPVLRFAKLSADAKAPMKGTDFSAGYDLYSAHETSIPAQGKATVMTDIQIELPEGCYGRVAPRSGLARNNHIDVGAGVIDRDYRGNVGVVMFNLGQEKFKVEKGVRIAQLICERIFYPELQEVDKLSETKRGSDGYGSTGAK